MGATHHTNTLASHSGSVDNNEHGPGAHAHDDACCQAVCMVAVLTLSLGDARYPDWTPSVSIPEFGLVLSVRTRVERPPNV